MKSNKNFSHPLKSVSFSLIVILILTSQTILSCQKDDDTISESNVNLKTISRNEISMDGIWTSGCVEANNNMILNESLNFNNKDLQINIKGFDNLQCSGTAFFNETILISFNTTGTKTVTFEGEQVLVNKIAGTAEYSDGRIETFKQVFFIDDTTAKIYMHHAIFEDDGGQVDAEGYPIQIIPIPITKVN